MSLSRDFDYFLNVLVQACSRIDRHYFQLPVIGIANPVFRERVYCYELYHQLRIGLRDNLPYVLDGEVDKAGHPLIDPALGPKKPDFIVHEPGDMDRNLAVIEVKSIEAASELGDDLEKLQRFLDKARYYRGIMLVYGDGKVNLRTQMLAAFEQMSDNRVAKVWHKKPGVVPTIVHVPRSA